HLSWTIATPQLWELEPIRISRQRLPCIGGSTSTEGIEQSRRHVHLAISSIGSKNRDFVRLCERLYSPNFISYISLIIQASVVSHFGVCSGCDGGPCFRGQAEGATVSRATHYGGGSPHHH